MRGPRSFPFWKQDQYVSEPVLYKCRTDTNLKGYLYDYVWICLRREKRY